MDKFFYILFSIQKRGNKFKKNYLLITASAFCFNSSKLYLLIAFRTFAASNGLMLNFLTPRPAKIHALSGEPATSPQTDTSFYVTLAAIYIAQCDLAVFEQVFSLKFFAGCYNLFLNFFQIYFRILFYSGNIAFTIDVYLLIFILII